MNETLDDIVAWIREIAQSWRQSNSYDKVTIGGLGVCDALEKIADRIEAAKKREFGNAAATREALDSIAYTASMIAYTVGIGTRIAAMATEIIDKTAAALAAPQRNCDVGTATEQAKRMHEYCFSKDSLGCPNHCLHSLQAFDCFCEWAQMPYNEKGGGK